MKREFDIESIGKKMPYTPPPPQFFDNFKEQMMERVSQEEPARKGVKIRLLAPIIAVAASLAVGLFIVDRVSHEPTPQFVTDNLDASIDSYFNSLSDDELAYLVDRSATQDSFYLTLPTNE